MSRLIKLIFKKYSLGKVLKFYILQLDQYTDIDSETQYFITEVRKILAETIMKLNDINGINDFEDWWEKMTKKERLDKILSELSVEEKNIIMSIPRRKLLLVLDQEHNDDLIVTLLKKLIKENKITNNIIEKAKKTKKKEAKKEAKKKEADKKERKEVTINYIPVIEEDIIKESNVLKEDLKRSYNKIKAYENLKDKLEKENKKINSSIKYYMEYPNYLINNAIYYIEAFGSNTYYRNLEKLSDMQHKHYKTVGKLELKKEVNEKIIDYITSSWKEAKKKLYKYRKKINKDLLFWKEEGLLSTFNKKEAKYRSIINDLYSIGKEVKEDKFKVVEDIELTIPKIGIVTISKDLLCFLAKTFNFQEYKMKRKLISLFSKYPRKSPIVNLNIFLDYRIFNYLLLDSIEDYLLSEEKSKDYNFFLSCYSKNVYKLFKDIGIFSQRITRKEKERKLKERPCYIYRQNIEEKVTEVSIIYPNSKKEYSHHINFIESYEKLEEEREAVEEEKEEALLQENL